MTHDELLEKIDEQFSICEGMYDGALDVEGKHDWRVLEIYRQASYAWKALRAVVELHKPSHQIPQVKQTEGCVACGYDIVHSTWEENWPCPTIEAIEKELK